VDKFYKPEVLKWCITISDTGKNNKKIRINLFAY
jgi:hypothetical protein